MANWKKIIISTGIGAGVIGVIAYASRLKRTSAELESVATANVHSLKLNGLTIRIDVKLKNPTSSSLKIKFPFVKVLFQNKVIGTSTVVNKDITIPGHGQANVSGIMVNIPASGLLSLSGGMIGMLIKKQSAQIGVITITTIDLGWKSFPYSKTDSTMLKPPALTLKKPGKAKGKITGKKGSGQVRKPKPVRT